MDGVIKEITIQRNYKTNGYSGSDNWVTFFEGYAKVQTGAGREFFAAKQRHSELTSLAEITQYVHKIDETMRVLIDGLPHEIIAIDGERENNKMELKLKQVK
jgi:SPP1 family predicted phage head-tail adaptor